MSSEVSPEEKYMMVGSYTAMPGARRVIFSESSAPILKQLEADRKEHSYRARSFLSSSYELPRTGREAMSGSTRTHIRLSQGKRGCRIWTYRQPICFLLEPAADGYLQSVTGFARAELPLEALHVFKTAVALLLDRLAGASSIPLYWSEPL